jgi:hypothetical protein
MLIKGTNVIAVALTARARAGVPIIIANGKLTISVNAIGINGEARNTSR